ncbi:MAG: T9SS type A sorting domain-containing protein [Bacteroidales bacterium]|nr:T9SS type A sorting domain-containing protein [Bacteroidales bacterium]
MAGLLQTAAAQIFRGDISESRSESDVVVSALSGKITVYPNPVARGNTLTIDIADNVGEITISLYNTVGKVIRTLKTSDKKIEIEAPDACGIYLIRCINKQKVIAIEKIVVKE